MKTLANNKHSFWRLVACMLLCELTGAASSYLSEPSDSTWYEALRKPLWTPPSYLFGAVWGGLYFLMGIALWVVWRSNVSSFQKGTAGFIFLIQLFLNFCWSILFFRFQSPALALADIVLLLIVLLITILQFLAISRTAAWLMVPYIIWVGFATYLNYMIWMMN